MERSILEGSAGFMLLGGKCIDSCYEPMVAPYSPWAHRQTHWAVGGILSTAMSANKTIFISHSHLCNRSHEQSSWILEQQTSLKITLIHPFSPQTQGKSIEKENCVHSVGELHGGWVITQWKHFFFTSLFAQTVGVCLCTYVCCVGHSLKSGKP